MPPLFNVIRTCILAAVFCWTLIVLGLAAHLLTVLESTELTHHVPLAIFVATATLFVMSSLWIGSCARRPHPIFQTRFELAWLGVLGILWLCLGAYTVSLPDVEVECFDDNGDEVDSLNGFSTASYHAQSHAIQAFSLLNAILLFGLFFLLLFLALRRNRRDPRRPVWAIPVTMIDWFGTATTAAQKKKPSSSSTLPPPVTARVTVARRATEPAKGSGEKSSKPNVEVKEIATAPILSRNAREPNSRGHQYVVWVPGESTTKAAAQRQGTLPTRSQSHPPRQATTTTRPTATTSRPPAATTTRAAAAATVRPPPAAQTRPTPGRSRTIPARDRDRDRDLPAPPQRDAAPLPSTTRGRPAPPARSGGAKVTQTPTPAPKRR